jgi:hypothetical protein
MNGWKKSELQAGSEHLHIWSRTFKAPKGKNNLWAPSGLAGRLNVIGVVELVRVVVTLDVNERYANSERWLRDCKPDVTWTAVLVLTDGREYFCDGHDYNETGAMQKITRRVNKKWRDAAGFPTDFCFDGGVRFKDLYGYVSL